ncbi:MAG: ABC transporter permease [Vicinamibacterales bacterium]
MPTPRVRPKPDAAVASDWLLRLAAPLVPYDIRREWLREWRAELAFAAAQAARRGRPMPASVTFRAAGAIPHAVWLRWDQWGVDMIWQDLKHAVRALRAKPGFTFVTLLTLALGIGGTAAIFGAVNAVLLRPLPYPDSERLVQVFKTTVKQPDRVGGTVSPPDFVDWRRHASAFSELAALVEVEYPLTGSGAAEQVRGAGVTGGFFTVLGTPALLGRTLTTGDDPIGSRDVVVLSHALWTRRFGADRNLIGRQLAIDGVSREVVGVMPAGFEYPLQSEFWLPLRFTPVDLETQRGAHYIEVVGRLKTGTSIEEARTGMRAIAERLAQEFPRTNRDSSASVHPLRDAMVGDVRESLFVLLGAVGLVLLIVCVNVASLVLIRAVGRGREMAVRVAMGANRVTLIRGLIVESLVLGVAGGAAGLVLASWATTMIRSLDPSIGIPLLDHTRLDYTVVAFTLGVSVLAAVLFGTLPAWQATTIGDLVKRIREEGGSTTSDPRRLRLRSGLIVAETTLAVVLLVGAGLLARSFERLLSVDLGFTTEGIQTFSVSLPEGRYSTPSQRAEFVEQLVSRVAQQPGVERAGAIFGLPLTNFRYGITTATLDGVTLSDEEQDRLILQVRVVTPNYFATMGIPVVRGRAFTAADRTGGQLVAVLNQVAAARLWPDTDALGHQLEIGTRLGQGGARAGGTVVGIAGDVHDHGPAARVAPTLYLAHGQFPVDSVTVVARGGGDPAGLVEPMRSVLRQLDADVPMFRVRSMAQIAANAVAQPRLYLVLIACFATTAMLLSAIGLYGVMAFAVGQRTREIGIRLALGARRGEVLGMVMRQAGALAVTGVAAGLVTAALASRVLRAQLFEVAPTDLATYVAVGLGLLLVAFVASWIPARRAARVDPLTALRHD